MKISVGYRVKSHRGTQFRQWANKVLKEYLLKGYSVNQRLKNLEDKVVTKLLQHEKQLDYLTKSNNLKKYRYLCEKKRLKIDYGF